MLSLIVSLSFIYFWLPWLLVAACRLLSGCGAQASPCGGFSRCGARAPGTWAQQLRHTGLMLPWHVESSWTRDRTSVPCIGRQILNHWTTREVPLWFLYILWLEEMTAQVLTLKRRVPGSSLSRGHLPPPRVTSGAPLSLSPPSGGLWLFPALLGAPFFQVKLLAAVL